MTAEQFNHLLDMEAAAGQAAAGAAGAGLTAPTTAHPADTGTLGLPGTTSESVQNSNTLVVNGNNPAEWQLSNPWQETTSARC